MARTDLPRVRHALVDQLVDAYLRRLGRERPVRPFERLAINTFGASIADDLVGKLITRDNLAALLQTGAVKTDADVGVIAPLTAVDFSNLSVLVRRIVPVKPVEFSFRLGEEADSGSISMHLEGTAWKLSAVNLPNSILLKLVERLPKRR